jgi:hypothetical protein
LEYNEGKSWKVWAKIYPDSQIPFYPLS